MEIDKKKEFEHLIKEELEKINIHTEIWVEIRKYLNYLSESINESIDGEIDIKLTIDIDENKIKNKFNVVMGLSPLDKILKRDVIDKSLDTSKKQLFLTDDIKSIYICEINLSDNREKFSAKFENKNITYELSSDGLMNFFKEIIKTEGFLPSVSKMRKETP